MKLNLKLTIATKMIVMTIGVLLSATVPIAFNAASLFKKESGSRERDTISLQAGARAIEVEALLQGLRERIMTLGVLALRAEAKQSLALTFQRDLDLVGLRVYARKNGKLEVVERLTDEAFLKDNKLSKRYLETLEESQPFPLSTLMGGQPLTVNRSAPKGAAILSLGLPLAKDALGKVTHAVVGDVQLSRLQKGFSVLSERTVYTVYLVDKDGAVLAHPDDKLALKRTSLAGNASVKRALAATSSLGDMRYREAKSGNFFVAAFAKTASGLTVMSEVPESVILEPAHKVQRDVLFIALLAVFVSILVITLFSTTLTRPIERLVQLTKQIARGDFNVSASSVVKSRDEVGTLATSFDTMLGGLRERDKVKNILNKFHGSAVAQSLLSSDALAVGGSRKAVVVLFSDIRSFTSFSEKRAPEQVVEMLNEYFAHMVRIINQNRGVVDKFIGDAIMAVWGAPQSSGDDAYYATKTCLEMRQQLALLNEARIARGEEPIKIGVGIHAGEVIAGTIGSDERMEYTIIGDAANVASRIEASTKAFGADILLSHSVAEAVGNQFVLEKAGSAEVKGKTDALVMYKLRGYVNENGEKVTVQTPYSDFEAEDADKVGNVQRAS